MDELIDQIYMNELMDSRRKKDKKGRLNGFKQKEGRMNE